MDISIDIENLARTGTADQRVTVAMEMIRRHGEALGIDLTRVTAEAVGDTLLTGREVLMVATGSQGGASWYDVAQPLLSTFSISTVGWFDSGAWTLAQALGIYPSDAAGPHALDQAWRKALGLTTTTTTTTSTTDEATAQS